MLYSRRRSAPTRRPSRRHRRERSPRRPQRRARAQQHLVRRRHESGDDVIVCRFWTRPSFELARGVLSGVYDADASVDSSGTRRGFLAVVLIFLARRRGEPGRLQIRRWHEVPTRESSDGKVKSAWWEHYTRGSPYFTSTKSWRTAPSSLFMRMICVASQCADAKWSEVKGNTG